MQRIEKYPPKFPEGQRQRVAITRCIALQPDFVIADEPIASLDVSIQAQIINLFKHLQTKHQFSFYLLPMTLQLYRYISDKIGVLYHGKLVEVALRKSCLRIRFIPYTKSLLSAVPTHRIQGRKK